MADGRNKANWDHTAAVLCALANIHRDAKKRSRPFSPAEFHPYEDRRRSLREQAAPRQALARDDARALFESVFPPTKDGAT